MVMPLPPAAITVTAPAPTVSISDLVEMTAISSIAFSPDGRWIAFRTERPSIARNRIDLAWYVVAADGSTPARRIADGGQGLIGTSGEVLREAPVWAPSSGAIYFRAFVDGEIQIWRAAINESSATRLTSDPANVRSMAVAADSASLTYTVEFTRAALAQAEDRAFDEGTPADGSALLAMPASRGGYFDGLPASWRYPHGWSQGPSPLLETPAHSVTIPLVRGDQLASLPVQARYEPATFDDRFESRGAHRRLIVAVSSGKVIACTASPCDDRGPVAVARLAGQPDYLVTLRSPAQGDLLALWNPATQASRTIVVSDGTLGGGDYGASCAGTGAVLACVAEGADHPPELVRVSTKTGEIATLFAPNAALTARVTPQARAITWQDRRGAEHAAQLILPTTPRPQGGYPLVMTYYICSGFPRGGFGGELPLLPLAQNGVATLCINRARTPSGPQQNARFDQKQGIADIRAALGPLVREGIVDQHRVGMWGYSFGSEVMSQVLIHTRILAAAAAASDLIDPSVYWFNALPKLNYAPIVMKRVWKLGAPDTDRRGWKQVAPALNVDRVRAPLLLQMPEHEARATIELMSKMGASRTPAEFWMFAHELHTKFYPRHQAVAMARNMDWFRYWLDHATDPDPAKRDQYQRWDALARRWKGGADAGDGSSP